MSKNNDFKFERNFLWQGMNCIYPLSLSFSKRILDARKSNPPSPLADIKVANIEKSQRH